MFLNRIMKPLSLKKYLGVICLGKKLDTTKNATAIVIRDQLGITAEGSAIWNPASSVKSEDKLKLVLEFMIVEGLLVENTEEYGTKAEEGKCMERKG